MDINDIRTWAKVFHLGMTFRVYREIVETHYGPEAYVVVWSPVTRSILGAAQECMTNRQVIDLLLDNA